MNNKISAAIVVKNNPRYLKETIDSIKDFTDEIVVFDIGIDNCLKIELVKNNQIKIVKIKKPVAYVELIREEEKKYLKNEWVLFLDPDEIFPKKTLPTINQNFNNFDCFSFPRKNIIFNHFVKCSRFWPDYQTRLFKKNSLTWPKEIHQQPKIGGKEFVFEACDSFAIVHYNYDTLDQWFEKYKRYAKSEADNFIKKQKHYSFSEATKKALDELISRYFGAKGYKDGGVGLTLAILQMFYYFIVYFYYLEEKKFDLSGDLPEKNLQKFFHQGLYQTNYWLSKEKLISKKNIFGAKLINQWLKLIDRFFNKS